jgi:TPR repeat protein
VFGLFLIAMCYRDGIGCAAVPKRGFQSLQALAGRGYLPAMSLTGVCYANGTGVAKDEREAVKWYRLAAHALRLLGL